MYWISKNFGGRKNIDRASDLGLTPINVAFISPLVNGGGKGHVNRKQFSAYVRNTLPGEPSRTGTLIVNYLPRLPAGNPVVCAHFPPWPYHSLYR